MKNRNRYKEIHQSIPEVAVRRTRQSQPCKSKAVESSDKGIRAWNKTKTIPERSNWESQPCKGKGTEAPDKGSRGWKVCGTWGGTICGIRGWLTAETPESCGQQLPRWSYFIRAFTLVELLVVVLIIGILAAIAVPQYQKAVQKSKAIQLESLLSAVVKASHLYYLNNGTYPTSFSNLDVDIPLPISGGYGSSTCASNLIPESTRKNDEIEIALFDVGVQQRFYVGAFFTTGKYKCTGFLHLLKTGSNMDGRTFCAEGFHDRACGTNCENGAFCRDVMGLKKKGYADSHHLYE